MATLPQTLPTGYLSQTGTVWTTTTVTNIDNGVATPDGLFAVTGADSTCSIFYDITNTPTNFGTMATLTYNIRYKDVGTNGDTDVLKIQVFKSDKTTALTDLMTVVSTTAAIAITNKGNTSFTSLDTTSNKSVWDGAVLCISTTHTKSGADDHGVWSIDEVEINGTYNIATTTSTSSSSSSSVSTSSSSSSKSTSSSSSSISSSSSSSSVSTSSSSVSSSSSSITGTSTSTSISTSSSSSVSTSSISSSSSSSSQSSSTSSSTIAPPVITFLEPGGDATFNVATTTAGGFWDYKGTTFGAIATDFVHGNHIKSLKYTENSFNGKESVLNDSGSRTSAYIYLNALPSSTAIIMAWTNYGTSGVELKLTSAGVLQLARWDTDAQIGTDGSTLSTGIWYRISLAYTTTSTTVNRFELFKNGISDISVTNATIGAKGSQGFYVGNMQAIANLDFRSSDHYIDNSSSLTDTGNIWVTAKRPVSNGTTNGFTGSGTNSGYGTGNSVYVNERPLATGGLVSMIGAGSAVTEEYNIEADHDGDMDITGKTIVNYIGWAYMSSLVGETVQFILNGASSSKAITSTNTMYTKVAGSATYPAGSGTDIGITTDTSLTTVSLYETGIMVAFIGPPVAGTTTSTSSSSVSTSSSSSSISTSSSSSSISTSSSSSSVSSSSSSVSSSSSSSSHSTSSSSSSISSSSSSSSISSSSSSSSVSSSSSSVSTSSSSSSVSSSSSSSSVSSSSSSVSSSSSSSSVSSSSSSSSVSSSSSSVSSSSSSSSISSSSSSSSISSSSSSSSVSSSSSSVSSSSSSTILTTSTSSSSSISSSSSSSSVSTSSSSVSTSSSSSSVSTSSSSSSVSSSSSSVSTSSSSSSVSTSSSSSSVSTSSSSSSHSTSSSSSVSTSSSSTSVSTSSSSSSVSTSSSSVSTSSSSSSVSSSSSSISSSSSSSSVSTSSSSSSVSSSSSSSSVSSSSSSVSSSSSSSSISTSSSSVSSSSSSSSVSTSSISVSTSSSSSSKSTSSSSSSISSSSSSSSVSSSSSSSTILPTNAIYSRENSVVLGTDDTNLATAFDYQGYVNVATNDTLYEDQSGSNYQVFEFKNQWSNSTDFFQPRWIGQTNLAPSSSPVLLQIFNRTSGLWETKATNNSASANVDFTLTGTISTNLSNYYDAGHWVSCRVY